MYKAEIYDAIDIDTTLEHIIRLSIFCLFCLCYNDHMKSASDTEKE